MKILNKIFQIYLIICIVFPVISAAERFSDKKNSKIPIEITADKMTSNQKFRRTTFIGNVVAKRDNLSIFADKMTVYNNKKGKKLEKIVAQGHVKIVKEGRFASGDRAVYIEREEKIVLTGNPRAWENKNEVTAVEMIFLINEDKFVVSGSKEKKVKLTLYPDQKKQGK